MATRPDLVGKPGFAPMRGMLGRADDAGLVAVLDVGTSKVAALIAQRTPDGLVVLGTGQKPCAGLKRGIVADVEKTEIAIRGAMDQAERAANVQVRSVVAAFCAGNLTSQDATADIDIAGAAVTSHDMAMLRAAARNRIQPGPRTVLHAQPVLYRRDGQLMTEDPTGFFADRLGMDVHVVLADTPPIKNLDRAIRQAHLGLDALVATPLAAAEAVLDPEERELGVALVDIGAGMTSIAIYMMGVAVGVATIPMGGADITADIASAFATRRSVAERLKAVHGGATALPRDSHEPIEVEPLMDDGHTEPLRINRAQLIGVVRHRLDLLCHEIGKALAGLGFVGPQARQIVLTGGSADLRTIADFVAGHLGRNVRVGKPMGLAGLPGALAVPASATLAGLALLASRDSTDIWYQDPPPRQPESGGGFASLLKKLRGRL
ncbi:MAG: cell division protein FtsA [Sphingomonadales bacterium]|jgi:cell division protein FtsA